MHALQFFLQYVKNYRETGAVLPSSQYLSKKMLAGVDFEHAETLVELGAGMGAITSFLVARKKNGTRLLVFESQQEFASGLEKKFAGNGVWVFCEYADQLLHILEQQGVRRADAVVSSLPLVGWKREQRRELFSMLSKHVWREGTYTQYQYFAPTYGSELREHFSDVALSFTPWNVPPAWVYTCRR